MSTSFTGNGSFPERYILVKNNELVQVRYLLLYGTTKETNNLCVMKCVESVKILCVRKLDVPLSMDDAVEVIFDS